MVQRREHLRFASKPRQTIRIESDVGWEQLERDLAIELRIAGAIHLAHAAGAEGTENLVRTELAAGRDHVRAVERIIARSPSE